jgi:hypothetical protein
MLSRSTPAKLDPRNKAWGMTVAWDELVTKRAGVVRLTADDTDSNVQSARFDQSHG